MTKEQESSQKKPSIIQSFRNVIFLIKNYKQTIQWLEYKASRYNSKDLKEHLLYLESVYQLCFSVHSLLDKEKVDEFKDDHALMAQMMLLGRITDFLRCIRLFSGKGYPDQAGTLASSVFELAHTALYFSYMPDAAKKWLEIDFAKGKMPDLIDVGGGYEGLVRANCKHFNMHDQADGEYKVYRQLCLMKHSHPKMIGIDIVDQNVLFQTGPYINDNCINNTWYSILHSGRLAEMTIDSISLVKKNVRLTEKLAELSIFRARLYKKATERFKTEDPFT